MNKLLTSKWFVAILGMVAFLVTMAFLWKPEVTPAGGANAAAGTNAPAASTTTNQPAHAEEPAPKQIVTPLPPTSTSPAGEPGSLTFNNPDLVQLRIELQQEKADLLEFEKGLRAREDRLRLEMEHLGTITQQVWQAKAALQQALERERTVLESAETNQIRQLSKVFSTMAASNAVPILKQMGVDEVARILHLMDHKNQAAVLEVFGTNDVNKATEIVEKMRTLAPRPELPLKK